MPEVKVDPEKCDGCGTCIDTCPVEVFELKDEKSVPAKQEECLACQACEVQCPAGAIEVTE
ncbi:MAG: 4Fe-4S binding protein [Candidatus Bathyarchaeota archaeon]|nr:MAG: 4Fe-4S binding protein [Candidatus Bathyarchaeota archaeon]